MKVGRREDRTSKGIGTREEADKQLWVATGEAKESARIERRVNTSGKTVQGLARLNQTFWASFIPWEKESEEFLSKQVTASDLCFEGVARHEDVRPSSTLRSLSSPTIFWF